MPYKIFMITHFINTLLLKHAEKNYRLSSKVLLWQVIRENILLVVLSDYMSEKLNEQRLKKPGKNTAESDENK